MSLQSKRTTKIPIEMTDLWITMNVILKRWLLLIKRW